MGKGGRAKETTWTKTRKKGGKESQSVGRVGMKERLVVGVGEEGSECRGRREKD